MNKANNKKIVNYIFFTILILLVSYLGFNIIQAVYYNKNYSIDFSKENFKNIQSPLFISEDYDSPKFKSFGNLNGVNYAEINYSPISITFKPEEFPINKEILFSSQMQGSSDWEITIVCDECQPSEKYNWQPFYSKMIFDNNYFLARYIDGLYIYALKNKKWQNSNNIDDWILKNIPKNSKVKIIGDVYKKTKFENKNIEYLQNKDTTIYKSLRGPHEFYIYINNEIKLEIHKKDTNYYDGSDEVIVELTDLSGKIVHSFIIEDDLILNKNLNTTTIIKKNITKKLPSGVYKLSFKEGGPEKSDWIINYLKINTNKIILTGKNNLILDPVDLYTEIDHFSQIGFYIWHDTAIQKVSINSNKFNKTLHLSKEHLNQVVNLDIGKGSYIVTVEGDQIISGKNNFAFNIDNYFKPYIFNLENDNPEFIITGIRTSSDKNWHTVSKRFKYQQAKSLTKDIVFLLKNEHQNKNYNFANSLHKNNFTIIGEFNSLLLYAKKKNDKNFEIKSGVNLNSFFNNTALKGSKVLIKDNALNIHTIPETIIKTNNLSLADFVIVNNEKFVNIIKSINLEIK